ncbi:MAG: ABC transporter ATP-binding protein [Firmicutes bacterium]|nr:ABC transporter ATP-binding protein [Bacillota bacterium]
MDAITVRNLSKYYGPVCGVSELDFSVGVGEVFGFIGPNGAGKTTTIRTMLGLIRPSAGEVLLFDTPIPVGGGALYRRVGYLPGEVAYYPEMTGRELIDYAAAFYERVDRRWVEELIERLQFDPSRRIRTYSTGNRKKLGMIQALLHKPDLAIFDEPTSGIDPLIKQEFFKLLSELNREGMTVFFSTHVLEEIERICDRVGIIRDGRLLRVDPLDGLPGRKMKIVTLSLAGGSVPDKLPFRWGRPVPVEGRPGFYRLNIQAPATEIICELSGLDLEYINISDPGMEDLFMTIYGAEQEGAR